MHLLIVFGPVHVLSMAELDCEPVERLVLEGDESDEPVPLGVVAVVPVEVRVQDEVGLLVCPLLHRPCAVIDIRHIGIMHISRHHQIIGHDVHRVQRQEWDIVGLLLDVVDLHFQLNPFAEVQHVPYVNVVSVLVVGRNLPLVPRE